MQNSYPQIFGCFLANDNVQYPVNQMDEECTTTKNDNSKGYFRPQKRLCPNKTTYAPPLDVFIGMQLITREQEIDWRKGRIPYLERIIPGSLNKIAFLMKCFRDWAKEKGLKPRYTGYTSKSKRDLRFSKSGDRQIEQNYRTHYISPILGEIKEQKIQDKLNSPPEQVVIQTTLDSECTRCEKKLPVNSYLFTEEGKALCLACANLHTWAFLTKINSRLARFLKRENAKTISVRQFTRSDKRYVRQGTLLEKETLKKAYQELYDEDFDEIWDIEKIRLSKTD